MSRGTEQSLRLPDGRRLSYAVYGAAEGRPVLLFHGTPGSRLLRHPDDGIARRTGVRVIVPDRPGMGGSDPQPGRGFLDWPAEALGLERLAVVGISGDGDSRPCRIRHPAGFAMGRERVKASSRGP